MRALSSLMCLVLGVLMGSCVPVTPVASISVGSAPDSGSRITAAPPASVEQAQAMAPITSENVRKLKTLGRGRITGIAWSLDGAHIAIAARSGIYLVDAKTMAETVLSASASESIAFSPDGEVLASAEGSAVALWDVAARQKLRTLMGHTDIVNSVAFSPLGNVLASGSGDTTVKVWDAATGRELRTLRGHRHFIYEVAFLPGSAVLASTAYEEPLKLWDIASGEELRSLDAQGRFSISPDGALLASAVSDSILLHGVASGEKLRKLKGHTSWVIDLAFSPKGDVLASASGDGAVRLWNVAAGAPLRSPPGHDEAAAHLAFSPDGTRLASASAKTVRIWDVAGGQEVASLTGQAGIRSGKGLGVYDGYGGGVNDVAFSPDGKALAAAYGEGPVKLFDVETGELTAELKTQIGFVNSVAFSPDSSSVAAGGGRYGAAEERGVQMWDVASHELLMKLDNFSETVFAVAFSPDGTRLAVGWGQAWGFGPGSVRMVPLSAYGPLADFGLPNKFVPSISGTVYGLAFSPDGTLVAAANGDGRIQLWDLAHGRELSVLAAVAWAEAVAFSPDGRLLATGGGGSSEARADLRLWHVATGTQLAALQGHASEVKSVAFSPDGQVLASAAIDDTVRLWDVRSGQALNVLDVPSACAVAFSPDGRLLATGGWGDPVRLWAVSDGRAGHK